MSFEERYARILGISRVDSTLESLEAIVRRHLERVPYENVSKILRAKRTGPSIPSFAEYVHQLEETSYGGTCFAQNFHLNQLLNHLGFDSDLMPIRREGKLSHVSLRVTIEGRSYLVDVGLMSSIAGPFLLGPTGAFDRWSGDQRFIFVPDEELRNYSLEIHRGGKMIRSFQSSDGEVSHEELVQAVVESFEPKALFMNVLCAFRVFESHSVGIWNDKLYRIEGTDRQLRDVTSRSDLARAFESELGLPGYELDEVLHELQTRGAPVTFGAV